MKRDLAARASWSFAQRFDSDDGDALVTGHRIRGSTLRSVKAVDGFSFQGIPKMLYADNGPISKSQVFLNVMEYLVGMSMIASHYSYITGKSCASTVAFSTAASA